MKILLITFGLLCCLQQNLLNAEELTPPASALTGRTTRSHVPLRPTSTSQVPQFLQTAAVREADDSDELSIRDDDLDNGIVPKFTPARDVSTILSQQHQERARQFDGLMQKLQHLVDTERPTERRNDTPTATEADTDVPSPPAASATDSADGRPPQTTAESDQTQSDVQATDPQTNDSETQRESAGDADDSSSSPGSPTTDATGSTAQSDVAAELPLLSNPAVNAQPKAASVFADGMAAEAIIDGPVDRIGLADNLYAINELQIALEMYQQVDLNELSESEWYWVKFQIASCYRRLGRTADAQDQYRRLAGQKKAGWLAKTARWWLDQMDARAALQQQIEQQDAVISALTEVLNDNVH